MAAVAHASVSAAPMTQLVMVRGVLLPMPQPDRMEDLPSPSVTPESTSLQRMANTLARQQAGNAGVPWCCPMPFEAQPQWQALCLQKIPLSGKKAA